MTPTVFKIRVTQYYLSQYPAQSIPPSINQVMAYMTLRGEPAAVTFYIQFYLDGTQGLSAPSIEEVSGGVKVVVDMYYRQLASIQASLNSAICEKGPPCFMSLVSEPLHAEFFVSVPSA